MVRRPARELAPACATKPGAVPRRWATSNRHHRTQAPDTDFDAAVTKLRAAGCAFVGRGTIVRDTNVIIMTARKVCWKLDLMGQFAAYDAAVATRPGGATEGRFCMPAALYAYPVVCFPRFAGPFRPLREAAGFGGRTLRRVSYMDGHVAEGHDDGGGNRRHDEHHCRGDDGVFHRGHRPPIAHRDIRRARRGFPPRVAPAF